MPEDAIVPEKNKRSLFPFWTVPGLGMWSLGTHQPVFSSKKQTFCTFFCFFCFSGC
jgi:hypothetical protein